MRSRLEFLEATLAELERAIDDPFDRNASLVIDFVIAELEKELCTLEPTTH